MPVSSWLWRGKVPNGFKPSASRRSAMGCRVAGAGMAEAGRIALLVMLLWPCLANPAHAGVVVSASVGYGHEFHPLQAEQATNIMVTPGYSLLADIVRPELGIVGAYGALRGGLKNHFELELRPMLRVSVPLVPVYARAIVAGLRLSSSKPALAYGGAIGAGLSVLGVGIFAEIGVLPRHLSDGFHWIGEARAGASYAF